MDLTEAEDIKNRWQEYTEELYKKDLHDPDNHDGVTNHLEPEILECEVKWALESITTNKASGGDGIPVELFQILEDDAVKVLHSIFQQIWKTQQWPSHLQRQPGRCCLHGLLGGPWRSADSLQMLPFYSLFTVIVNVRCSLYHRHVG